MHRAGRRDPVDQQEQRARHQRAVDHVEQARRHRGLAAQAQRQQQRARRADHQVGDQAAQPGGRQRAHRAQRERAQGQQGQPGPGHVRRRAAVVAEHQRVDPGDRVHAHLGHDREQGRHRRGGGAVGLGQPEVERQQRGLDREHHEQQQAGGPDHRGVGARQRGHALGQVGHVQRAGEAVEQRHRDQEQRGAGQVEGHVVDRGLEPRRAAAVQQQAVRRDQQHLEEHEQVEQVGGQEGAVQPHQLELEEGVEVRAARRVAGPRVQHAAQRHQRGEHQHQRGQAVERERDPEGGLPVAEQVGVDAAAGGSRGEHQRHHELREHREQRQQGGRAAAGQRAAPLRAALEQQQECARQQRQDDREDDQVGPVHVRSEPPPSTWSDPVSRWVRSAMTSISAVIAKPITIAVSTRACGRGSA